MQTHRPAWLISAAFVAAGLAVLGPAGCTHADAIKTELTPFASRVLASGNGASVQRPVNEIDSFQLANAPSQVAMPRLAFATVESAVDDLKDEDRPAPMNGLCPADMVSVEDRFCVDKFEASLLEVL